MNLQDQFLNQVRKENIPVTIYLIGGFQLRGLIKGFDAFIIMLDSPGKPQQLVYKHAISTVAPARPVNMSHAGPRAEGSEEEEESLL